MDYVLEGVKEGDIFLQNLTSDWLDEGIDW